MHVDVLISNEEKRRITSLNEYRVHKIFSLRSQIHYTMSTHVCIFCSLLLFCMYMHSKRIDLSDASYMKKCVYLLSMSVIDEHPTNCLSINTRARFTQKWCIINALTLHSAHVSFGSNAPSFGCSRVPISLLMLISTYTHTHTSLWRTLIFHDAFSLSHSHHRQLILEIQKPFA